MRVRWWPVASREAFAAYFFACIPETISFSSSPWLCLFVCCEAMRHMCCGEPSGRGGEAHRCAVHQVLTAVERTSASATASAEGTLHFHSAVESEPVRYHQPSIGSCPVLLSACCHVTPTRHTTRDVLWLVTVGFEATQACAWWQRSWWGAWLMCAVGRRGPDLGGWKVESEYFRQKALDHDGGTSLVAAIHPHDTPHTQRMRYVRAPAPPPLAPGAAGALLRVLY